MKNLIGKRSASSPALPKILFNNSEANRIPPINEKSHARINWDQIKQHSNEYNIKR